MTHGTVINFCFSCRFGWVGKDIGKTTTCPNCRGANTAVTKELKTAEPRVRREVFEDIVTGALKDPELRKINAAYLPLYWKLKKY